MFLLLGSKFKIIVFFKEEPLTHFEYGPLLNNRSRVQSMVPEQ